MDFSFGKLLLITVLFIVIIGILMSALWAFGVFTSPIVGKGEAYKEIQSKEFRLGAYNYFFNQYHSIIGLEGSIDENLATLELLEKGTKEYNRILTNVTALKSLRHQAIQEYNANATKEYTAGQFRDAQLPYQIEDTDYPLGD